MAIGRARLPNSSLILNQAPGTTHQGDHCTTVVGGVANPGHDAGGEADPTGQGIEDDDSPPGLESGAVDRHAALVIRVRVRQRARFAPHAVRGRTRHQELCFPASLSK